MFYVAVRGTDSAHRADIIRAFATVVRAVGEAAQKILRAACKLLDIELRRNDL
jgi:hypothetical protein